jgi:hypothetical protein
MKFVTIALLLVIMTMIAACAAPAVQPTAEPTMTPPPAADPNEPVSSETGEPGLNPPVVPTAPYNPSPDDSQLQSGQAFIDSTDILTAESFPPQFFLSIKGSLPTPCHALRVRPTPPDAQHRILIDVYSVVDPTASCIQVLEPFEVNIPLGSLPAGKYEVWVNNQPIGEIEAP